METERMNLYNLPLDLQKLLAGGIWQEISVGRSSNSVYRIVRSQEPVCYLKIAPHPFDEDLFAEKERLAWLQGRLPVPAVYSYIVDSTRTYLLLSEIVGMMAYGAGLAQKIPGLLNALADGLRLMHGLDITACPFDQRLASRIALARQCVQAGLVDEADFDEKRKGMSAEKLFDILIETQPQEEDLVFTHGDYCLPNIFIDPLHMRLTGFIDWGRAGIADRYQDLALTARSLTYNFGSDWEAFLWKAYGLEDVDLAKIEFYQLLDEFF